VNLERLQLSQSEGSKTIGQWYRRYLRIGWEGKFPSLIQLQDQVGEKTCASGIDAAVDTKVWAIPSSNCATHFLLAQWSCHLD